MDKLLVMKKVLIVVLVFALVITTGIVIYFNWRHNFLRHELPNLVFLKSDSLYKISYDDIYIDEVGGEVKIKNLRLVPDTTYKKTGDSTLPRQLLNVLVPELHITGVKTDQALLNSEIVAGRIELTDAQVVMYSNPRLNDTAKRNQKLDADDIYRAVLRSLERITVDTIILKNASYSIVGWITKDTALSAPSITAQLYNLNISDSTRGDTSRVLFSKKADLDVKSMVIREKKGRYNYKFNDVALHSNTRRFDVKSIYIVPLTSESEFMREAKYQTDRFNFDFNGLQFSNINVQELLQGNMIADSLVMDESMFKIFRDLSYPREDKSKKGNYPHQLLMKAPMDVALKTVVIRSGLIEYKEKNPKSDSSGKVRFQNVYAVLHNVSNRDEDLKNNSVCTLTFKSNFLGKAPINATLQMYLADHHGKFSIKGTLSPVDATVFNELTRPMGLASIESGKINRLNFNLAGSDDEIHGTVLLLYNDLKVTLLKKDEKNNELKKKKLASLLANAFIINENPKKNKTPRTAMLYSFPRDMQRSFFNLLWKSIFTGVKQTVGMGQ
jgi:hypothetical protein